MKIEEFVINRQRLGLFGKAGKFKNWCEALIASRVAEAEKNGSEVSASIVGYDPWDNRTQNRPERIFVDTSRSLVKVFDVVKEKVTESTLQNSIEG